MRMASSSRRTPGPVTFAVSSACFHDMATNEMAARLYTSSGWLCSRAPMSEGRSWRSPEMSSTKGSSDCTMTPLGLFWPLTRPNTW